MSLAQRVKNSLTFKIITIGFLLLLLLIPTEMISGLINERMSQQYQVFNEISATMGGQQIIGGLLLTVPYREHSYRTLRFDDGTTRQEDTVSIKQAHFLPDSLNISGELSPEVRYRGIFKVLVYAAKLKLSGRFLAPKFEALDVAPEDIIWEQAFLSLPITHPIGIRETPMIRWGEGPETALGPVVKTIPGLHSVLQLKPEGIAEIAGRSHTDFSFDLRLTGSEQLHLLPHGRETRVELKSPWATPSFNGAYLPTRREISAEGFTAAWTVLELARGYPQQWRSEHGLNSQLMGGGFGVELMFPTSVYQQSTRSIKYSFLFIFLTFLVFFLFELFGRLRIHPLQYTLVGFAVALFYLNLLALSEHMAFGVAYLIATLSSTLLISGYSAAVLGQRRKALLMGGFLLGLYGFLYVLLRSESHSLLLGALGLSGILSGVMYATRRIDWYAFNAEKK
ncbi:cell envelope integrity protein CreD [Myxococcota bacterium]|nr:cell envelope integrity protein CreD [Myxococcota bacterium]